MDPMIMAKKQVYIDLIKEMRKRMVAAGETPDPSEALSEEMGEGEETAEVESEESAESGMCVKCGEEPCSCDKPTSPKGMTITLAAIKKAPKPSAMPSVLENALMGKGNKYKKKA